MWPDLWGPGWVPDILCTIGIVASVIGLLKRLVPVGHDPMMRPDPVQDLWRRYEQGDLTRWEFQRRRRAWIGGGSPAADYVKLHL